MIASVDLPPPPKSPTKTRWTTSIATRQGRRLIGAVVSGLIGLGALAFAAVALFDLTHYSGYTIPGGAMAPTIDRGTHVWTRSTDGTHLKTGEIVVLRTPSSAQSNIPGGLLVVARIVAVAGQTVVARGGQLTVDGRSSGRVLVLRGAPTKLTVPRGTVYVLGDNRLDSGASNSYGPVPVHNVEQRVVRIDVPSGAILLLRAAGGILLVIVLVALACWCLRRAPSGPVSATKHDPSPVERT